MKRLRIDPDVGDCIFRALFSTIFLGLGGEHIFSDELIQQLMPDWVPIPRFLSVVSGVWLVCGGTLLLIGWQLRWAALGLGIYVAFVTGLIHLPGLFVAPPELAGDGIWIWDILQRSNLAKNLCLLGVCVHLLNHRPGKFSLEAFLRKGESESPGPA